mgnify:CR=1 FL=1
MSIARKQIEVVAAVIRQDEAVLCVQRPENDKEYISKKWEFPGGKVELQESLHAALQREIEEELALEIRVRDLIQVVQHAYPDFDLTMHVFFCDLLRGDLTLREHIDYRWLSVAELSDLDWAAADVPIVARLCGS